MVLSKPHNDGQWTTARFNSFVKSALRAASRRWPPKHQVKKDANRGRGKYLCNGYERRNHIVPVSLSDRGIRSNNVFVDHIVPVVDPVEGFTTWDEIITRMFVEKKGLQVLCQNCHQKKTKNERAESLAAKRLRMA